MYNYITTLFGAETIKTETSTFIENAIGTIAMDPVAAMNLLKEIWTMPLRIRDGIYWENFVVYLFHLYDYDESRGELINYNKRKLAEMLAEDTPNSEAGYIGNPEKLRENSKRLIKLLDDAGTKQKAIYYANLTRAALNDSIDRNKFFKLCNCVRILTEEDLLMIVSSIQTIQTSTIKDDLEFIDDFRSAGLLKEVEGGFAYTKRAFELLKYCLKYEESVQIPKDIKKRLMMSEITLKDIDEIIHVDNETLVFDEKKQNKI